MNNGAIHETAVVSGQAELHPSVAVGPFAVIEAGAVIGEGTTIGPHAVIHGCASIGSDNFIDAHAVIGGAPQHAEWQGGESRVRIGDGNVIRESVTIHRAFKADAETVVGSHCYLMANSHVGHDCRVGDHVILTNGVLLGGHVEVGRNAVMGGNAAAHQFTRVGAYSMVAGYAALRKDVLPYSMIGGEPLRHFRLNSVGLRRNGITGERYRALENAFRSLRSGDRELREVTDTEEIRYLRDWLSVRSRFGHYGFARPGHSIRQ